MGGPWLTHGQSMGDPRRGHEWPINAAHGRPWTPMRDPAETNGIAWTHINAHEGPRDLPWAPMGSHGHPTISRGRRWSYVNVHGSLTGVHRSPVGRSWGAHGHLGASMRLSMAPMGLRWILVGANGSAMSLQWAFMGSHASPMGVQESSIGLPRGDHDSVVGFHGSLWVSHESSMDIHGLPRVSDGRSWVSRGHLWFHMDSHASMGLPWALVGGRGRPWVAHGSVMGSRGLPGASIGVLRRPRALLGLPRVTHELPTCYLWVVLWRQA